MPYKRINPIRFLLLPFSILYGIIAGFRNFLFDLKILPSKSFDISVISLGNLTVGGTGKTPHTEYIVSLLKGHFKTAVLSRGYKRKSNGFVLADEKSSVLDIGDEPRQMKNKFPDVPVAVNKRRVKGIKKLMEEFNDLNVVILDDAFQHRYVKPGLSILLMDYNRPVTKDFLMPVGRLRERVHEKRRANVIIITKTPEDIKPMDKRIINKKLKLYPYQQIFYTRYQYGKLQPVVSKNCPPLDLDILKKENYQVLLITGIADPSTLLQKIQQHSTSVMHIKYPDHHKYKKKNIRHIVTSFNKIEQQQKIIITTEKDAMRLREADIPEEILSNMYYIPIHVEFEEDDEEMFNSVVTRYVSENKIGVLHK